MRKYLILAVAAFFYILYFCIMSPWGYIKYYNFMDRDIGRTLELLKGNPIFFGPELTGGGNLFGPFYYFLLAPPLILSSDVFSVYVWMAFLSVLGHVLVFNFLKYSVNTISALLWLLFSSAMVLNTNLLISFFNPSFSFIFFALILLCSIRAFSNAETKNKHISFYFAFLLTGLAIQIHFANLIFLFGLLSLVIFSKLLQLQRYTLKQTLLGLACFVVTIVPFLSWFVFHKMDRPFGQKFYQTGEVKGSLPSLFEHFQVTLNSDQFVFDSFSKILIVVPPVLIILLVVFFIFYKNKKFFVNIARDDYFKVALVFGLFAVVPFSFYFFVPQGFRYSSQLCFILAFLAAVSASRVVESDQHRRIYSGLGLVAVVFILILEYDGLTQFEVAAKNTFTLVVAWLVISLFLLKTLRKLWTAVFITALVVGFTYLIQFRLSRSFSEDINFPNQNQWKRIISQITSQTGWSYEQAMERLYFINMQREATAKRIYDRYQQPRGENLQDRSQQPDGFFISVSKQPITNFKLWIKNQTVQDEVKHAVQDDLIVLNREFSNQQIFVSSFRFKNKADFPDSLHNSSMGYLDLESQDEWRLINELIEPNKVIQISDQLFALKVNNCQNNQAYCNIGVKVTIRRDPMSGYEANIRIVGAGLSQSSIWINPEWIQSLMNPYFTYTCENNSVKINLISSLGYNTKYEVTDKSFQYVVSNNSVLAPFSRTVQIPCLNLKYFAVGWEGSIVLSNQVQTELQGFEAGFSYK